MPVFTIKDLVDATQVQVFFISFLYIKIYCSSSFWSSLHYQYYNYV